MNDDLQTFIDPGLEARIAALVLGEASAFEREELEREIAGRPELQSYRARLENLHETVGNSFKTPDDAGWKLPPERREEVLVQLREGSDAPSNVIVARAPWWRSRLLIKCVAVLAVLFVVGGVMIPLIFRAQKSGSVSYTDDKYKTFQLESPQGLALEERFDDEVLVSEDKFLQPSADSVVLNRVVGQSESRKSGGQGKDRTIRRELASLSESLNKGLDVETESRKLVIGGAHAELPAAPKPASPSSSASRVVVANGVSPSTVPVPSLGVPDPTVDFSNGGDFGNREEYFGLALDGGITPNQSDGDIDVQIVDDGISVDHPDLVNVSESRLVENKARGRSSDTADTRRYGRGAVAGKEELPTDFDFDGLYASIDPQVRSEDQNTTLWSSNQSELQPGQNENGRKYSLGILPPVEGDAAGGADEKGRLSGMKAESLAAPTLKAKSEKRDFTTALENEVEEAEMEEEAKFSGGSLIVQERLRREASIEDSERFLKDGREAYAEGDYDKAVDHYRRGLDLLPFGTATTDQREELTKHLQDGAIALTQKQRRLGKYAEARNLLEEVEKIDPGNEAVAEGLEYLDDPIKTNQGITYEHSNDIDKVRRNLYKGEGYFDLGLYDKAEKEFKDVLRVDPYNKAARRWLERANAVKSDYYRAAYDQARAEMLMEVDEAWTLAAPPTADDDWESGNQDFLGTVDRAEIPGIPSGPQEVSNIVTAGLRTTAQATGIVPLDDEMVYTDGAPVDSYATLKDAVIPELNFEDVSLDVALKTLSEKIEKSSGKKVHLNTKLPTVVGESAMGQLSESPVIKSMKLKNVPADVALGYLAQASGMRYKIEKNGDVNIFPLGADASADIVQKQWKLAPEVIAELRKDGETITDSLKRNGITFSAATSASVYEGNLIVRNTPTNNELVEAIVVAARENAKESSANLGSRSIRSPGKELVYPEVSFLNTTVEEALDFVRLRSIELDPVGEGINLILDDKEYAEKLIPKLEMKNASLDQVLGAIAKKSGLKVVSDEYAFRLSDKPGVDPFVEGSGASPEISETLSELYMEEVEFNNTAVVDSLGFFQQRVSELLPPSSKVKKLTFELADSVPKDLQIGNLELRNVPIRTAVEAVARQADLKYRFEGERVILFSDKKSQKKKIAVETFETSTAAKSDSTFSLNVSDVSFKLAKAALSEGRWPEQDKVRPEEFINAFDYKDSKPSQDEKIACVIEQGGHPFMQQRNLLRISMSTAALGRNASTPLRLTILLDQSGSMERQDRARSVQRAFALLAQQLKAGDEVTLVGFARTPRLLAERLGGENCAQLVELVSKPLTEGGTNLEAALATGLQMARQQFHPDAQNRIILLTDGAANLGDAKPETLAGQVGQMRAAGIAFDACGVGADGLNDEILTSLTKEGDGRYYFLDRPEDADAGFARQIAGALRPAAKNVKVQVLFNPERVAKFKLYGYKKHELKKEDFRNDSVDAAEMAAEESGVALYHIEPIPEGRGDLGTVAVRFLDPSTNRMVERTWAIPYNSQTPPFGKSPASLRLAGVAGFFAEKLKGSPVGERVELKRLRQETETLKLQFQSQVRFQELQSMLQQAGQ